MNNNIINQIYIGEYLVSAFSQDIYKYGLVKYYDTNKPSFFYGIMRDNHYNYLLEHKAEKIIIWTGGDINNDSVLLNKHLAYLKRNDVYHIAISKSIVESLKKHDLKYIFVPFMGKIDEKYSPYTLGNSVYVYAPYDKFTYDIEKCIEIMQKCSHVNYIFCTSPEQHKLYLNNKIAAESQMGAKYSDFYENNVKVYEKSEIINVYKKCFLALRLTKKDGLSASVQELGCMGIKTVHNGYSPSCLQYNTTEDIIKHINTEKMNIGKINLELAKQVRKYLELPKHFFTLDFFKNDINYFFDKIYILNLDKEANKWKKIKEKLELLHINNVKRFPAVDGRTEPYLTEWKKYYNEPSKEKKLILYPGVLGMIYSLIEIINDAKKNNYKKILFLEDDIIFIKNFHEKFNYFAKIHSDSEWKLMYLGANDRNINNICEHYYNATKTTDGGFAIGINETIYDELLNELSKKNCPPDAGAFQKIISKYKNVKISYPNLIIADVSKSTVRASRNMQSFSLSRKWNLNDYDYKS